MYTCVGGLLGYAARISQPGDQTSLDAMALDTCFLPHHMKDDLLGQCQDASRSPLVATISQATEAAKFHSKVFEGV